MTDPERGAALEVIAAEVRSCTRCRLHQGRTRAVPGEGDSATEVVFVGEGPGFNEDRQGRPFVGQAGAFLEELLASIGWRRDDVFITNIVKCRPPGNRDPEPDEIAACAPFLERQLGVLDPAVVVTLGRHSLGRFMPGARIGAAHGTSRAADPATGARDALVFAMYHPAAALHQGSLRQTLLTDAAGIPTALLASRRRRGELESGSDPPAPPIPVAGGVPDLGNAPDPEPGVAALPEIVLEPDRAPDPQTVPEPALAPEGPIGVAPGSEAGSASLPATQPEVGPPTIDRPANAGLQPVPSSESDADQLTLF